MKVSELVTATQACHQRLRDQRQNIVNLYSLFLRTSAAYYAMCEVDANVPADSPDLLLAMAEFHRRGLVHFGDADVERLSKDYVQSLKLLQQAVNNAISLCDQLATLVDAQRAAPQTPPERRMSGPDRPPTNPEFNSLDEAIEHELRDV